MENKIYKRKFGQWHVTIETEKPRISICGEWFSNFGLYYYDGNVAAQRIIDGKQVIGMDNSRGLTESVKKWIYQTISRINKA